MKNAVSIQSKQELENIVSAIVHIKQEFLAMAMLKINSLPGVEAVAEDPNGKVVLVISADTAKKVMIQIETIQDLQGVYSAAMVAHHTEETSV